MILYFSTETTKVFQMWTSTVGWILKIYIKFIILFFFFLYSLMFALKWIKIRLDKDIKKKLACASNY